MLTLSLGTGGSQAISLLSVPILTRIYTPDDFGLLGIFTSLLLVFGIYSCGGYEQAIMVEEEEEKANHLFHLSGIIPFFLCAFVTILLFAEIPFIDQYLHLNKLEYAKWLLPLSLFPEGWSMALKVWHNRNGNYQLIATARFLQAIVTAILSIGLGLQGHLFAGLIIGFVAGQWAKMLWMLLHLKLKINFNFKEIKALAIKYKEFLKYGTTGTGLNTFSQQLPNLMLPNFYGESVVGFFSIAVRVLSTPLGFLGISVGDVYFEKASKVNLKQGNELQKLTRKTAKNLLLISILFFVLLFPFAPQLFQFAFGEKWSVAGEFARFLLPWTCLSFISNPLSYLFDVKQKLKEQLLYNALLFTARFGVLFVGGTYFLAKETIAIYGLIGFIFAAGLLAYLLNLSKE